MSLRIEQTADEQTWESAVDRSPQTTVFHRYGALQALARFFDADLTLLVGYVGQEPVGVFPLFDQSTGPFRLVTSPPLAVEIHAGPALLNFEKLSQRKAERRHQRFVDGCLDWIDDELEPSVLEIKAPDRYTDVRPFLRREFDVTPSYTYVLDVSGESATLRDRFSSDARRNIDRTDDDAYVIEEGDREDVREIVSLVRDRFDELGEYHYLDPDLVIDLYSAAGPVQVRPYVCRVDGAVVGGIIALEDGDTIYRWQGGTKPDVDLPVNDLLDWRLIRDATESEVTRYDLVGAIRPRLCEYKSKFGPTPTQVHLIRDRTVPARIAEQLYRRMPTTVRGIVGL